MNWKGMEMRRMEKEGKGTWNELRGKGRDRNGKGREGKN